MRRWAPEIISSFPVLTDVGIAPSALKISAMSDSPNSESLSRIFSEAGKKGAIERARCLSPERRKEIAKIAAKAAAEVRSKKAAERQKTPTTSQISFGSECDDLRDEVGSSKP
jgi:hypothetical protein